MLCILPAQPEELPIVVGILDDAARWMLQRGIQQWESPCPPDVWDHMAREIGNGQVYLARLSDAGAPVGTLRLEWKGMPLWPAEADAGYIHSMAVRPAYMGRQVGKQMLEWAIQHIRSHGKTIARLDCMSDSRRLRAYYESAGFLYRGDGLSGTYRLALYELAL